MASTSDSAKPADGIELRTPPKGDGVDKGNPLRDGLYILTNKMARTVLDVCALSTFRKVGWSSILTGPLALLKVNRSRPLIVMDGLYTEMHQSGTSFG